MNIMDLFYPGQWFVKRTTPRPCVLQSLPRAWPPPPPPLLWTTFLPATLLRLRDYVLGLPASDVPRESVFIRYEVDMLQENVCQLVQLVLDNANSTGGSLKHNADGTVTVKYLTSTELLDMRDFMKKRCKEDKKALGFYCMLNDVVLKTMSQSRVGNECVKELLSIKLVTVEEPVIPPCPAAPPNRIIKEGAMYCEHPHCYNETRWLRRFCKDHCD